ncbi:MAG: M23 family metallopeptidase, partial [Oscillospiraceae bacterium]|nr:M23 family metallopeptidase [Oscillospiraceae bacterium]
HEGGYMTVYGHCSFVCVTEGQQVRKGEMIAGVGTTGNSTGDHLHFEIRENGIRNDPMLWFSY